MKLSKMIDKSQIYLNCEASNKRQLLQELAENAAKVVKIDSRIIFDALLERENLGSTGFGGGTSIPHTRISNLGKVYTFLAKLPKPIDFNSVDGKNVDLVFLLLSPEENGADHLTALAKISRVLKNEDICNKIRKEDNSGKILSLLESTE